MVRLQILGPRRLLPDVLADLQRRGVLDLRTPLPPGEETSRAALRLVPIREGEHAVEEILGAAVDGCERLRAALPRSAPGAAQGAAVALPDVEDPAFPARIAGLEAERAALDARVASLREERRVTERYGRLLSALAPLHPSLPRGGEAHPIGLVMRRDARAVTLLGAEVRRLTDGNCTVQTRPAGEDQLAVLVTVPEPSAAPVANLLFERGVEEIRLPSRYAGQPLVRALGLLLRREREIPSELAAAEADLAALAGRVAPALREALAEARSRLARIAALARCGETRHAFVVTGFVPDDGVEPLRKGLAGTFGGRVVTLAHAVARGDGEDVPVVLRNPPWIRPFERLLALVPPPRYDGVDPTPWLAVFFPLFFGLVLGDAAFGAGAMVVAAIAIRRGWRGAAGHDFAVIALACGAAALLFGVLFGEALGDLGARLGMRPILLHRREALLSFLALAIGIGLVHVSVGTGIGLVHALRRGHVRHALEQAGRLVTLAGAAAAGLAVAGVLPRAALVPAVAVAGGGALLSLVGGPMALLEVVLTLGNVLSYARLMALGIASVMLADVANHLAVAVHPAGLGLALALLLHGVNFTLGLMSPLIASLRLHYVEFFEKFYEGGGRPYRPFAPQA
jgi:V/A-type H+-transporting ATPase subunit I